MRQISSNTYLLRHPVFHRVTQLECLDLYISGFLIGRYPGITKNSHRLMRLFYRFVESLSDILNLTIKYTVSDQRFWLSTKL